VTSEKHATLAKAETFHANGKAFHCDVALLFLYMSVVTEIRLA
jgi:hypothetical protein